MLLDMSRDDMRMLGLEQAGWYFVVKRQVVKIAQALLESCEEAADGTVE